MKDAIINLLPVLVTLLLLSPCFAADSAREMEVLLPPVACASGWQIEGKPQSYNRDTLSNLINGEAELYFPYGFDWMAAARYAARDHAGAGIDLHVYRMGSLLDAFGMYANYRQKDGRGLPIGVEASLSGTQLFFYQGRYFVQIQITGADGVNPERLVDCAKSVAKRLDGVLEKPQELLAFERPEVVKETVRYLPHSLLGYDFFSRGLIADAVVEGTRLQLFTLLRMTPESASAVLDHYRVKLSGVAVVRTTRDGLLLEGVDPLYGPVMLFRRGGCLVGAIKFNDSSRARHLLENVCR